MNEVMIGAISGVVASLIGAILTAYLSYRFQDALLEKQMKMQRDLVAEQNRFQEHLMQRQRFEQDARDAMRPNG